MERLVLDPDSGDVKMFTKLSKTQNILNASAISSIIVMIFFFFITSQFSDVRSLVCCDFEEVLSCFCFVEISEFSLSFVIHLSYSEPFLFVFRR